MLRSVKYGLSAGVLAAIVAGIALVATSANAKTVDLTVDGRSEKVHTTASDVAGALKSAGLTITSHDVLVPGLTEKVHNGSDIVLKRGRQLHLLVNGRSKDVWTTAPTVADALSQLGYAPGSFVSISRDARLPVTPTDLVVRTPKQVTFVDEGKRQKVMTTAATIGQLISQLGIKLGAKDRLKPARNHILLPAESIVLTRIKSGTLVATEQIPYPVTRQPDSTLSVDQTQLVKAGKPGRAEVTYAVTYVNGKVSKKTEVDSVVLAAPVAQVQKVGTKPLPPVQPAIQAPVAAVSSGTTAAQAMAIGRQMAAARGWGADQFNCLAQMWGRESGWNVHAGNPDGAYGIPQALPGSKMASAGGDWEDNAQTQIAWGLSYIAAKYGTPCGAWSVWQSQGWY